MAMHDWKRVEAGIYHHFHHEWISAIAGVLNNGLLPSDLYALAEQQTAGFGPDVLTLQDKNWGSDPVSGASTMTRASPKTRHHAKTPAEFHRRRKSSIGVRHVSNDRVVAIVEIITPGNKSSNSAFRSFLKKAWELLEHRVHLLLIDPFPPGRRDPNGTHAAIWEAVTDDPFQLPSEQPLTMVAYECADETHAYIETIAVGEPLPDMPLFLEPGGHIMLPLESTYDAAWKLVPARWRRVIESDEPVATGNEN